MTDGWLIRLRAFTGGAAPYPAFQTVGQDIKTTASPVVAISVSDALDLRLQARNAGLNAAGFHGVLEPISVMDAFSETRPFESWRVRQG